MDSTAKAGALDPTGSDQDNNFNNSSIVLTNFVTSIFIVEVQTNKKKHWILFKNSLYLNEGTGKAWAWQRSPKLWRIRRVNATVWRSVANVGALAPTGSSVKNSNVNIKSSTNRKLGTGWPWAWQRSVTGDKDFLETRSILAVEESLGAVLLTGSNNKMRSY